MQANKIVCYLFTIFDEKKTLVNFVKHYKKYKPGLNHKLVICFKLFTFNEVVSLRKYLKDINYIEFLDPGKTNDWDFGSYYRVSKKYPNRNIFFMNSHSYPVTQNWLKKIMRHYKKKTIIDTQVFLVE